MKIGKADLERAAELDIINPAQVEPLWRMLGEAAASRPRFDLIHLLYYFGALLVIGAMGWFMTTAWEELGGGGIFLVSVLFTALFISSGTFIWRNQSLRVPGGLLITMAVCMTPLMVYGLQRWLGIWPFDDPGVYQSFHRWIRGGWFPMEVATIAAGILALRFLSFRSSLPRSHLPSGICRWT